ncbi:MAG: deoxyribonuclease IV [Clostridia bacterium]|nr:deoxyribonuclease IV [Clostridia bacterium]
MLKIGCHLSASKGYAHMGREIVSIGGNTFQFFTRNPRGGSAKAVDEKDCLAFRDYAAQNGIDIILAHAPYTLNGCSKDESIRDFARRTMLDDLQRMEYVPGNLYNFHPGSHVGQGVDVGIEQIADMLNAILWPEMQTTVLLETMAGKGSEVGSRFEELRAIIDRVELKDKVGICMDTCHVNDAGYDIVNHLEDVLGEFDRVIGLDRLKAVHINDSKNPLGAHKDRHEKIGLGYIGTEGILGVMQHPALRHLPFYLETPNELDGYQAEIALLKEKWV